MAIDMDVFEAITSRDKHMSALTIIISGITTLLSWLKARAKATQDLKIAEINARRDMVLSRQMNVAQWELAQLVDKDKILRYSSFLLFSSPFWSGLFGPGVHNYVLGLWNSLSMFQENILAMICAAVFGRKTIPNFIGGTIQAVVGAIRRPLLPAPKETEESF